MLQNITAIVDKDFRRCFVLPLNRSDVIPPRDFWDLVSKIGVSLKLQVIGVCVCVCVCDTVSKRVRVLCVPQL